MQRAPSQCIALTLRVAELTQEPLVGMHVENRWTMRDASPDAKELPRRLETAQERRQRSAPIFHSALSWIERSR